MRNGYAGRMVALLLGLVWVPCSVSPLSAGVTADWPQTRAERSNFQETSTYEDVIDFMHALQRHDEFQIEYIGETTEGRRIPLAVMSRPPMRDPSQARRSGRPIIFIQGNIHAGEVEGKEAAQSLMRRLLQEGKQLEQAVFLILPIYNIDGNERFGPVEKNRPGQGGPPLVGVRPNAQGLDLNRDAIKADSPEMRALLEQVYNKWDPDVIMDLHTTNGTRHGYELTYSPPLNPNTESEVLAFTRDRLLPSVRNELRKRWQMETFDYGNAATRDGQRRWETFSEEGRYITNYAGLRNRIGILSEATSYLSFQDRIVATERFVDAVLEELLKRREEVVRLTRQADAHVADSLPGSRLGVRFELAARGVEDVLLERPAPEGQPRRTGRPTDLEAVPLPVYDRFRTVKESEVPHAYLVPASQAATIELLLRHGIIVEALREPWRGSANVFTISEHVVADRPFQNRRLTRLEGEFRGSDVQAEAGWVLVRTAQPLGVLAFHILEPEGLDGAAAWGFIHDLGADRLYPVYKVMNPLHVPTERMRPGSARDETGR
jgi:hypothetical protein